jgi:hypothetical protein
MEWCWAVGGLLEPKGQHSANSKFEFEGCGRAGGQGHVLEETDGEDRAMK